MDVHARLAELRAAVEGARSMPMSASAVVNRGELLTLVDEVAAGLDAELAESRRVLAERDAVVALGQQEADRIVADARAERDRTISEGGVSRGAQEQADRLLEQARTEAEELRKETDDYVDAKLANFEVTLERTAEAVRRGRSRLAGSGSDFEGLTPAEADRIAMPEHLG